MNFCLRGSLPNELSSLKKLQWLLLDNNQLTGSLPAYLGELPDLKQAQLQHNSFAGPVPVQWCSGQATYHIAHNNLLCGENPHSMHHQLRLWRSLHAARRVSARWGGWVMRDVSTGAERMHGAACLQDPSQSASKGY